MGKRSSPGGTCQSSQATKWSGNKQRHSPSLTFAVHDIQTEHHWSAEMCGAVFQAVLKQLAEKIDRTRRSLDKDL